MFRELEKEKFMNMLTLDSMTLEGLSLIVIDGAKLLKKVKH